MIYFITDRKDLMEEAWLECMIKRMKEGVEYIVIRDKGCFEPNLVKKLMAYKKAHGFIKTKIIIHSQLELAQEVDADGIHLPYALWEAYREERLKAWGRHKIIGVSIHTEEEAKNADGRVNYMFLSPVFNPSCKPVEGKGITWFNKIQAEVGTPLVALGGITPENVRELYHAGITDIAVMSYLMTKENKIENLKL